MNTAPFIAVEGPIGAGKTTLASMLSEKLSLSLVKEIVEENPFLDKFYDDKDEWSFQLEMFFLCNRYKQLEDTEKKYLHHHIPVVSDYHIYKNLIFAERTLEGKKLEKYRKIYHLLTEDLPKPNVIIYIKASLPTLLERIKNADGRLNRKWTSNIWNSSSMIMMLPLSNLKNPIRQYPLLKLTEIRKTS